MHAVNIMSKTAQKKYILYAGPVSKWMDLVIRQIKEKDLPWRILEITDNSLKDKTLGKESEMYTQVFADFNDAENLKIALEPYISEIIGAVNRSERNIPYFQKIIPHLPKELLVPTVDALIKSTEKTAMRKAFWKYDKTITPKFEIITEITDEEIARINKRLEFPVIVKPSGLAQAVLVQAAHYPAELKEILLKMQKYIQASYRKMKGRGTPTVLIEELIEGDQYSVEAFVNDIGNVDFCPFIKYTTSAQKGFDDFFSYEQSAPATISPESAQKAKIVCIKGIHALGLRNSIAHIELIRKEGSWKIVEIGPRMGGFRSMMYEKSFGIKLDLQDIKNHLGKPVKLPRVKKGYTSVIKFFAKEEGTITKITGIKKAESLPSFVKTVQNLKKGDTARFAKNGGTYAFYITLFHSDKAQFIEDKRKLEKMIHIETKKQRKNNSNN